MCALTRRGQLSVRIELHFDETDRGLMLHRGLTPEPGRKVSTSAKQRATPVVQTHKRQKDQTLIR